LLVIAPDLAEEQSTPVYDWVVVGRECAGVEEKHRLLIEHPAISRTHLEVRLDFEGDQAWLTDHSTNGTRLNGKRIERSIPVTIKPGDRIRLGQAELQFRSRRFSATSAAGAMATLREINVTDMVMVVGDILSFSTIAENTGDRVLLENIDRLYAELRQILARHLGHPGQGAHPVRRDARRPQALTPGRGSSAPPSRRAEARRPAPGISRRGP
jgi:adenylate cyclase